MSSLNLDTAADPNRLAPAPRRPSLQRAATEAAAAGGGAADPVALERTRVAEESGSTGVPGVPGGDGFHQYFSLSTSKRIVARSI